MKRSFQTGHLNVGIIGCGRAAEIIYVLALKEFPEIKITAVCDPLKDRRELLSKYFGNCLTFEFPAGSFTEHVDAAVVLTPPETHIKIATQLLRADKYVLVEKPLSLSTAGTKELMAAEASSRASLMIGFNLRYWDPVINLKNKLAGDRKTDFAEFDFTTNYSKWNPVSFVSDPLDDLGPHVFDLISFIFNTEIISVKVNEHSRNELKLEIKISGQQLIYCRLAHTDSSGRTIRVKCGKENFLITVDSTRITTENAGLREILNVYDILKRKLRRETSPVKNTFEQQLKRFFYFVKSGQKSLPGIKEGIDAVKAAEAARKSLKEHGKEIYLNEIIWESTGNST